MGSQPAVAIFDLETPPALAFIRSLGRAGIPMQFYSPSRWPPARLSRWRTGVKPCPPMDNIAEFEPWLCDEVRSGRIQLVAPTSDQLCYHIAMARQWFAPEFSQALPRGEQLVTTLFKDRFASALEGLPIPAPAGVAPRTADEAVAAAEAFGYPVALKPKSHVGNGHYRGALALNAAEVREAFVPHEYGPAERPVFERFPGLELPLVQAFCAPPGAEFVSISGVLDASGQPLALLAAKKGRQWPGPLGVGLEFEVIEPPPFLDAALKIVREVLGTGIFEIEILRDPATGALYALDLNPRGFGQMSLDIAAGNDLPVLWYAAMTGRPVAPRPYPKPGKRWRNGFLLFVGQSVALARGGPRRELLARYRDILARGSVDVAHDWRDPLPGLVFAARYLRHPRGLIRPFWKDWEPFR